MQRNDQNSTLAITNKLTTTEKNRRKKAKYKAKKKSHPVNVDNFSPSTAENTVTTQQNNTKKKGTETLADNIADDYVVIESEEIDPFDYIVDGYIKFNMNAYTPRELNKVIFEQFSKSFSYQTSIKDPDTYQIIADIFKKITQKIVIFHAVKDYRLFDAESHLQSLDQALTQYKKADSYTSNDIIVIPVAELSRQHFRLLTIKGLEVNYFDSKSYLVNMAARSVAPLYPATLTACVETEKMIELKAIENYKTDTSPSVLDKVLFVSSAMGFLASHAVTNYPNYLDHVKEVCAKHFPEHTFNERPLGDQPCNENTNCGPLTAAYAEQVANGKEPGILEDVLEIRARQSGHKFPVNHNSESYNSKEEIYSSAVKKF